MQFPVRVNSGHPLFIGYGRTGESPFARTTESPYHKSGVDFLYRIDKGLELRGRTIKRLEKNKSVGGATVKLLRPR